MLIDSWGGSAAGQLQQEEEETQIKGMKDIEEVQVERDNNPVHLAQSISCCRSISSP